MKKVVNSKCFIYASKATLSLNQSEREAVADQIEQLKKLAKGKGLVITQTFIDAASGSDYKRKELRKMLNLLQTGDTKIVLCTSIDRLSRNYVFLSEMDHLLKEHEVALITPNYVYGESSVSDFKWEVFAFFAKSYRQMISESTKRGIALAKTKKKAYEPSK